MTASTKGNRSRRTIRTLVCHLTIISIAIARLFVESLRFQNPKYNSGDQHVPLSTTEVLRQQQEDSLPQQEGRFAYAFVISGCTDTSCLGYILNSVVAAQVVRDSNSTADVLLMVRMATSHEATRLLPEQESWLEKAGVKLRYIKKVKQDNFGTANFEKFRVLQLHEDYDRVFFLDADVIPMCNADYIFHESYRPDGILSDFVSLSGGWDPMSGAFFLVKPQQGEFRRVIDIVRRGRERSRTSATPGFDRRVGWGHEMVDPDDTWQTWSKKGQNWTFYGAEVDQGILYHYFKYMLLNFTHIHMRSIQTWREVTNDAEYWRNNTHVLEVDGGKFVAKVEERTNDALRTCGGPLLRRPRWHKDTIYGDFFHFDGRKKPWNQPILVEDVPKNMDFLEYKKPSGRDFWMYYLGRANYTLELNLPSEILVKPGNPLGYKPRADDLFHDDMELPLFDESTNEEVENDFNISRRDS